MSKLTERRKIAWHIDVARYHVEQINLDMINDVSVAGDVQQAAISLVLGDTAAKEWIEKEEESDS